MTRDKSQSKMRAVVVVLLLVGPTVSAQDDTNFLRSSSPDGKNIASGKSEKSEHTDRKYVTENSETQNYFNTSATETTDKLEHIDRNSMKTPEHSVSFLTFQKNKRQTEGTPKISTVNFLASKKHRGGPVAKAQSLEKREQDPKISVRPTKIRNNDIARDDNHISRPPFKTPGGISQQQQTYSQTDMEDDAFLNQQRLQMFLNMFEAKEKFPFLKSVIPDETIHARTDPRPAAGLEAWRSSLISSAHKARNRRSVPVPVTDYGDSSHPGGGGADVVVDLLAEVSGLEAMVRELVSALQRNMAGVGSEFTNVRGQVAELQRRFESAFTMLNGTMWNMHAQVASDVSALRADVYRLHAALQGSTPTGQRLIVQPDRPDSTLPKAIGVDCASLYKAGARESGVYMLQPDPSDNGTKMAAYCDMRTAGGGWTVIQRRVDGSEDFFRSWNSYKRGFGSLMHDFWLGLDNIHRLTKFGNTHLRVELHDWDNKTRVGEFRFVRVMNESDAYRILAGAATGDAGDPFHSVAYTSRLQSMRFSTFDVDNDLNTRGNCAQTFTSGWWFNSCFSVNLNGVWYGSASYVGPSMNGIVWDLWDHQTNGYSLRAAEMKLRTENF